MSSRSILFLQGSSVEALDFLTPLIMEQSGDWLFVDGVSPKSNPDSQIDLAHSLPHFKKINDPKTLLGQEFLHAIFDATQGFNLDNLAILAGTLKQTSLLIIILPDQINSRKDKDSVRWNDSGEPIITPNFNTHLEQLIELVTQSYPNYAQLISLTDRFHKGLDCFHSFNAFAHSGSEPLTHSENNQEQRQILKYLNATTDEFVLITGKRGRGKSAIAGQFSLNHSIWVTAPSRSSLNTVFCFNPDLTFFAPDELITIIENGEQSLPDWIIIDEVARVPLSLTIKILNASCRILMTTTTEGYEGTGQGVLLKLSRYPIKHIQLKTPMRWGDFDVIEYFVDRLTFSVNDAQDHQDELNQNTVNFNELVFKNIAPQERLNAQFSLLWELFKLAHYRTTLIDLRRLLDADNLDILTASYKERLLGAIITVEEGSLSDDLAKAVLSGYSRPRGNLIAQSLIAHTGVLKAGLLSSIRINRIAVDPLYRNHKIGTRLVQALIKQYQTSKDFISVSFAYEPELLSFWVGLGFKPVHIGFHQESSSGRHSVMAIYPLTLDGKSVVERLQFRLYHNLSLLSQWIKCDEFWGKIPFYLGDIAQDSLQLEELDKSELQNFSSTLYSYVATTPALKRLTTQLFDQSRDHSRSHRHTKNNRDDSYPYLSLFHSLQNPIKLSELKNISKREFIHLLREEIKHYLKSLEG